MSERTARRKRSNVVAWGSFVPVKAERSEPQGSLDRLVSTEHLGPPTEAQLRSALGDFFREISRRAQP